jgi:hypothetical protein
MVSGLRRKIRARTALPVSLVARQHAHSNLIQSEHGLGVSMQMHLAPLNSVSRRPQVKE